MREYKNYFTGAKICQLLNVSDGERCCGKIVIDTYRTFKNASIYFSNLYSFQKATQICQQREVRIKQMTLYDIHFHLIEYLHN